MNRSSRRESALIIFFRAGLSGLMSAATRFILFAALLINPAASIAKEASLSAHIPTAGRATLTAGDLRLTFQQASNSVRVASLFDLRQHQELLATNAPPLFSLTLREVSTKQEVRLTAESGWRTATLRKKRSDLSLRWENPEDERLQGILVNLSTVPDRHNSALHWKMAVQNESSRWSIWRVQFPQLALADLGESAAVLFPRGPGEEQKRVWERSFRYRGSYPGGWCSMQFMAAYRAGPTPTGLYFGLHDPMGSTKDIELLGNPTNRSVRMVFDVPAPDMGKAGNNFTLPGEAVWQLLRGDWFDAAMIYKAWVKNNARWWPRLGKSGREDSPLWTRELSAWALGGGAPGDCVPKVKSFQQFLGVPAGFHWYNWHQIPFDNDYPHYFPTKTNVAQGVSELRQANVFVMPYINGRLWDTLDRGSEDFEFTKAALPAASKRDDGTPYTESYGSKETNGQPVRLAPMCPTTSFWQQTVSNLVLRLMNEVDTSAVYIDQVAAAPPTLCMDAAHGHPLGGGHWWNEGYWKMLEAIRRAMPRDRMLTTECNGEPFVRWFDGYLTWHWQHDGQVPAFPAVYGGALQMFGRAYRGGATKDLALRMKAGQQLVFGEQLGWIDPGVVKEATNAEFFRRAVQMRDQHRRYFYAGEMARPPKLLGDIPKVKADWQWSGEWWVTTDAVVTGAWRLPKDKRLVLLFANVSDQFVTTTLRFDAKAYGIRAKRIRCAMGGDGAAKLDSQRRPPRFEERLEFAPRSLQSLELTW
ncbi:MAG: hypothetical protein HY735_34825 [Verrucomicrobia bacterium]|nr:hypothetical protein [Verrucomicrobiota bacterium]